jgi:hypothetical protein
VIEQSRRLLEYSVTCHRTSEHTPLPKSVIAVDSEPMYDQESRNTQYALESLRSRFVLLEPAWNSRVLNITLTD